MISYWGIGVCHLCGGNGIKYADNECGNWYKCEACGTHFQSEIDPIFYFEVNESREKFRARLAEPDRIKEVHKILSTLGKGESIIDVGCGTGWLIELIGQYGTYKRIVATDLPTRNILIENPKIEILHNDFEIEGIPEELKGKFDHAITYDVIEHTKYPTKWLGLLRELLKDGGKLYGTYCTPRELKPSYSSEWRFPTTQGMEKIITGWNKIFINDGRFLLEK